MLQAVTAERGYPGSRTQMPYLLGHLVVVCPRAGGPDVDPAIVRAADEEGAVLGEGGPDLRVAVVVPLVLGAQVEACSTPSQTLMHRPSRLMRLVISLRD